MIWRKFRSRCSQLACEGGTPIWRRKPLAIATATAWCIQAKSRASKLPKLFAEATIKEHGLPYASWGPILWPFLRSSARDPTIKAVRGTVAIKGAFSTIKRAPVPVTRGSVPLRGHWFPLLGDPFP